MIHSTFLFLTYNRRMGGTGRIDRPEMIRGAAIMALVGVVAMLGGWLAARPAHAASGAASAPLPAPAPAPTLAAGAPLMVNSAITPGSWRVQSPGMPVRQLCLSDIQLLLQLQHSQSGCSRLSIVDKPDRATVHYSCPGAGWGRTSVVVTTPRLVLIDTQGIAGGEPFAYEAEARRTGDCDLLNRAPRH